MTPFYLRFTDEAEAIAKLKEAGLVQELPKGQFGHAFDNGIDLIGESYRNDAVIEDGKVLQPATKRSGYFANWIGEKLPAVLVPFATEPATPFRVFAGFSPEEIAAREAAKNPPAMLP